MRDELIETFERPLSEEASPLVRLVVEKRRRRREIELQMQEHADGDFLTAIDIPSYDKLRYRIAR